MLSEEERQKNNFFSHTSSSSPGFGPVWGMFVSTTETKASRVILKLKIARANVLLLLDVMLFSRGTYDVAPLWGLCEWKGALTIR